MINGLIGFWFGALITSLMSIAKEEDEKNEMFHEMQRMRCTEPRKHGHWDDMGDFEQCSVCHGTHLKEVQTYYGKATWVKMSYCPHCGAKMDEVEE